MARRRWQKGYLYEESGLWKLRYWMDVIENGELVRKKATPEVVGRAVGPGKLTKRQAEAIRDQLMAIVNTASHKPQASITVAEYVEKHFMKGHVATVSKATAKSYADKMKWILPAIGTLPMRDVRTTHVQSLLTSMAERGYARSTILNTKRAVHTVFAVADDTGHFYGRNPAARVKVPVWAKQPEPIRGYTLEEVQRLLAALDSPLREMCALGCLTSMHGAELAGLRIGHLNFSDQPREIAGRIVRPEALIVCETYSLNQRKDPKNRHRVRVLPIPAPIRSALLAIATGRPAEDPLFVMPQSFRRGRMRPVDTGNVTSRRFRKLSKVLGFPVNWHRLRHTNATWSHEAMLDDGDRAAMMGHSSTGTTNDVYTDQFERQKRFADHFGWKLMGRSGDVQ